MTRGEKMLQKLEGKAPEDFAKRLEDAYSSARYRGGFTGCIKMLRKLNYNDEEIETILRSKIARWAADSSKNRYGNAATNPNW
jgi:hypothetical protein